MVDASAAPPRIRHEWYQSDSEVVLSVFIKNVQQDDVKVDLAPRSLSLNIKQPTGSELAFDLDPLARAIDTERSTWKVMSTKIEFKLVKQTAGIRWSAIEGDEESNAPAQQLSEPSTHTRAYPSSAKNKKNWDAIAADVTKEEESASNDPSKDPNAGGDRELNSLFQKLYANATDEQRKAMIKSYQESNGTSLSTNWDEVKKKKVETLPPDSMVARKWEQ